MKKIVSACLASLLLALTACEGLPYKDSDYEYAGSPADENAAKPEKDVVIRLAVNKYMPYEVDEAIKAFNAEDNGYQIQRVTYNHEQLYSSEGGSGVSSMKTADLKLQMDIIQGNVVDMVADAAFEEISRYEILTEKGAFIDLYPFLDGNTGTSRAELNEHILQIHETDGKLYQMPMYFNADTMIGLDKYVGSKENWTLDDLIAHWEEMPDNAFFCNDATRMNVYQDMIRGNLGAFVDYKNGACSFDSPEFIRLLNFCNSFHSDDMEKTQPDWDTPIFLKELSIKGFYQFHNAMQTSDLNSEYTLVGYPSEDGNGSFIDTTGQRYSICMSASQEVQSGAWEFISFMLSEDFQFQRDDWYKETSGEEYPDRGFPVNSAAFQRKADELLAHAGEPNIISQNGRESDIGWLTQEEYKQLIRFINSLSRMNAPVDKSAQTIIEEEIGALFAGERSAEDVAKAIQGRIEIMISERM